jgi:hypothetical protein
MAQKCRDHAGLCKPEKHGPMKWISAGLCRPGELSPAEQRLFICGLSALKALGAWPSAAEILQACADLRVGLEKQRSCMCISPAWQALGAQACGVDIVHVCAGLGDTLQWNRDCACVDHQHDSSWGCGLAMQRSCRPERPGPTKWMSVQSCAGLRGMAQWNRDRVCGSPALQTLEV